MQGSQPVTGKMPVPQVLLLKGQHYITSLNHLYRFLGVVPESLVLTSAQTPPARDLSKSLIA
jgi:hypothetical protein